MGRGFGPKNKPSMENQKAKDFKGSIVRLFSELKKFKVLVVISLILACLSAIISIFAPDRLSILTDEISVGLVIDKDNMTEISSLIAENLSTENLKTKIENIINLDITNIDFNEIMNDDNISNEEKMKLFNMSNQDIMYSKESMIYDIGDGILRHILSDSYYKSVLFTVDDKIEILNNLSNMQDFNNLDSMSSKLKSVLLNDINVKGTTINSYEQFEFLEKFKNVTSYSNVDDIYKSIDEMPESIYNLLKPKMDLEKIKKICYMLLSMYFVSAILSYAESIIMTNVSNNFARRLRKDISIKINKLPLKYFDRHQSGDILSRVTNDVDNVAQSMNQSLATLVTSLTLFLGSIIMMFVTNYIMALTAIISSLIGFFGMSMILKSSQKYFVEKQTQLGNLNGHIEEIFSGLSVVKAYNGKAMADKKFDELNKKVCDSNRKSQFLSGIMHPLMGFVGNFGYVAVCIVGALLASNGNITFGVIVAFMTYVRLFTNPLSQIAQALTSLQSTAASSERVFEFLDEEEMKLENDITANLDKDKAVGNIEFDNVVFQYDNNDKPTIKGFTASAKSGQKIAIVGPTGAGKTTLVNLLMKFYDINSGDIKIDGISIKELSRSNVHSLFTMVLQDTWLFDGTIKENIIYNRENISESKVEEVLKIVGLDHFIKTLPDGINTIISENDSVSAGQRQLLTIARGMVDESPFLILDEATSNVDTRTEELVQKAMDKLTEGRTSFIIAHRLSTIKNADLILVINEGNIVEQGDHESLIKQDGFYAKLYNAQFEL